MLICPHCSEENLGSFAYCIGCGADLKNGRRNEGKNIFQDYGTDKYCTDCGTRLGLEDFRCPECKSAQPYMRSSNMISSDYQGIVTAQRTHIYMLGLKNIRTGSILLSAYLYFFLFAFLVFAIFLSPLAYGRTYFTGSFIIALEAVSFIAAVVGITGTVKAGIGLERLMSSGYSRKAGFVPPVLFISISALLSFASIAGVSARIFVPLPDFSISGFFSTIGPVNITLVELTAIFSVIGFWALGSDFLRAGRSFGNRRIELAGRLMRVPFVSVVAPAILIAGALDEIVEIQKAQRKVTGAVSFFPTVELANLKEYHEKGKISDEIYRARKEKALRRYLGKE